MASEFDTIDELRADLRERLGRVRVLEQATDARDRLLEQLLAAVDFPLPESAVKSEIEMREHDVVHALGHDDTMFEQYLQSQDKTREQFEEELRGAAERGVRVQFILDAIADKEQVQVGEGELTEYLIAQARRYNMPPQDFANEIVKAGNLPAMMADIRRNKALAGVLEHARVSDASGNPIDLSVLSEERAPAPIAEAIGDVGADDDA
jgi:trigger factor